MVATFRRHIEINIGQPDILDSKVKPIFLMAALAAATFVSACGDQAQSVTRTQTVPLHFGDFGKDYSGATSTRSSVDLLSLG